MRIKILTLGLLCFLIPSLSLAGWKIKASDFPAQYQDHSKEILSLRGVGGKTLFMMRVFLAGFYMPSHVSSDISLDPKVSKYLSVVFYAKFSSKDFLNFTIDTMEPNITPEEKQSLQSEFQEMGRVFPNIKVGDQFALSYKAGEGTTFIHNGMIKGFIPGETFSKAIFSTWIGSKPFDVTVKQKILGLTK